MFVPENSPASAADALHLPNDYDAQKRKTMTDASLFLIAQAGKTLAAVEASDVDSAMARAKGLGHILDFSPSLPLEASRIDSLPESVPTFRNEYFELLGFTS